MRVLRGDGSVFSDTFAFATSTLQTDQRLNDFSQRSERHRDDRADDDRADDDRAERLGPDRRRDRRRDRNGITF